jgi:hypothetical protein
VPGGANGGGQAPDHPLGRSRPSGPIRAMPGPSRMVFAEGRFLPALGARPALLPDAFAFARRIDRGAGEALRDSIH